MKTYTSLSIDIIHFEAQDVITSSTAICNCNTACFREIGNGVYEVIHPQNNCTCKATTHTMP